jgi:hypothetical protein
LCSNEIHQILKIRSRVNGVTSLHSISTVTSLWDVLIFDKELDKQVQTLIETSTTLTFEYRDLTNLLNGRDVNSESHLDVINVC